MSNIIIDEFNRRIGNSYKYSDISNSIIAKYENVFVLDKDEINVINLIWKEYGLCRYKKGLFWLVNPDDYLGIEKKFPNLTKGVTVFARTILGNLFVLDDTFVDDRKGIFFYNIHKGGKKYLSGSFEVFFEFDISRESLWEKECYGEFELTAVKKFNSINFDECVGFVPALKLGGEESIDNMEVVNYKTYLDFVSQL